MLLHFGLQCVAQCCQADDRLFDVVISTETGEAISNSIQKNYGPSN